MEYPGRERTIRDLGVLVVDDDGPSRQVLARYLSELMVRSVHLAEDGVRALDILGRHGPDIDVIVCDILMPRMSGIDLLHALRTVPESPLNRIPFLVLSARRDVGIVREIMSFGVAGYIAKPIGKAELGRRLALAALPGR